MKRIPIDTALIVLSLCGVWLMLGSKILPSAAEHDFLNLYTGATMAHDADLHVPEAQLAVERRLVPKIEAVVPFVRPRFYALMLSPLAWLPYRTGFQVWIGFQCLLLLGCWAWAWKRFGPDALVFGALALPAPLGIASGQDCTLMLAIFIVAFELARRERWAWSGAALALMLIKFHLVLLWPIALVLQRRWRMLAGYVATAVVLMLPEGVNGARSYAALLTNKSLDHLSPSPQLMISYEGFLANLDLGGSWILIAAVVALWLWSVRTAPLWKLFTLTGVASLIIVPHVYGYDATLLMLPFWLTIFNCKRPLAKIAATLMATPLPFGFALADKPWAVVASLSLLVFFAILALSKEALTDPLPESGYDFSSRRPSPSLIHLDREPLARRNVSRDPGLL